MWQCGNVTPSERYKPCSDKGLLPKSNIASVAMLLGMVAMLLIDPRADLPWGLPSEFVTRWIAPSGENLRWAYRPQAYVP